MPFFSLLPNHFFLLIFLLFSSFLINFYVFFFCIIFLSPPLPLLYSLLSPLLCSALLYSTILYSLLTPFICPLHITHTDMSRPKIGIFAKHIIPQTNFSFTLHRKDFRLLWAINCGSYSLLPLVPVYEPELLDQQLDAVMR